MMTSRPEGLSHARSLRKYSTRSAMWWYVSTISTVSTGAGRFGESALA
jgi:hypothetical protein